MRGISSPRKIHVRAEILAYKTDLFLGLVHHVEFIAHVEARGDEFLKVIGEDLTADVEAADCLLERAAFVERGNGCVGVSRVNDKNTFGWGDRTSGRPEVSAEEMWCVGVGIQCRT